MESLQTPILFIVFNRIDTASRVFEKIRAVRPRKLFIFGDGPRSDKPGEAEACKKTRDYIVQHVDWECELKTQFLDKNLGLPFAVVSGITWFFEHNEKGIILEHDCLPGDSFFEFMEAMLIKYNDDIRVFNVGANYLQPEPVGKTSYYFSRIPHVWGWGTWRRAWAKYDIDMKTYPDFLRRGGLSSIFHSDWYQTEWKFLFDQVYYKRSKTWDFQWTYTLFSNNGASITPNKNLVTNIGFGEGAVHSLDLNDQLAHLPVQEIDFPLIHPTDVVIDEKADEYLSQHYFYFSPIKYFLLKLGLLEIVQKIYWKIKH
jgi:hypothetical protein